MSGRHIPEVKPAELQIPDGSIWAKLPVIGLALAAVGGIGSLALAFADSQRFFYSFLTAFLFVVTLCMGSLFFVLIQHATNAGWSITLRRLAENVAAALPFIVPFFLVVLVFGMGALYPWTDIEWALSDSIVKHKMSFLSPGFFTLRALVYVAIWIAIALYYRSTSAAQDLSGDHALSATMRSRSYPALALYALTLHFAMLDWAMSTDPHFFSTIWGVYFFAGSAASSFALLSLLSILTTSSGLISNEIITVEHRHDIGKLTFAFVVFWTYIAFSQFFLIWYADVPEETYWYANRITGGWEWFSYFLLVGHFIFPFFYLMSRHIKRNPATMAFGALWVLFIHYIDMYWLVMPNMQFRHDMHYEGAFGPQFAIVDITTLLLFVGLLIAGFGFWMRRSALVPVQDPRLQESLAFENF